MYLKTNQDIPLYTIQDEVGDIVSLIINADAFDDEMPKEDFIAVSKFLAGTIADIVFSEGEEGLRRIRAFGAPTSRDWRDHKFSLSQYYLDC